MTWWWGGLWISGENSSSDTCSLNPIWALAGHLLVLSRPPDYPTVYPKLALKTDCICFVYLHIWFHNAYRFPVCPSGCQPVHLLPLFIQLEHECSVKGQYATSLSEKGTVFLHTDNPTRVLKKKKKPCLLTILLLKNWVYCGDFLKITFSSPSRNSSIKICLLS